MIGRRRSRRERDAFAQSAGVAERASARVDGARASTRTIRTRRLSEGIVIEASVLARLLRFRLLTLDASILLLPAGAPPSGDTTTASGAAPARRAATGSRLSDAIRSIEAAEQGLARAGRTSPNEVPREPAPRRAMTASHT